MLLFLKALYCSLERTEDVYLLRTCLKLYFRLVKCSNQWKSLMSQVLSTSENHYSTCRQNIIFMVSTSDGIQCYRLAWLFHKCSQILSATLLLIKGTATFNFQMGEKGGGKRLNILMSEYPWCFGVPTWDIYLIFLRSW